MQESSPSSAPGDGSPSGTLLCAIKYPPNSGYAWNFIERLVAAVADHLQGRGVVTYVGYPVLDERPAALEGSAGRPVALGLSSATAWGLLKATAVLRRLNVRVLYLPDATSHSWRYVLFRLAGVRWIVAHVHAGGPVIPPAGIRRALKILRSRVPGMRADAVVAVSDFVAEREHRVALVPRDTIVRLWNSVTLPGDRLADENRSAVRAELGIEPDARVVATACRADEKKGVKDLLLAFEAVAHGRKPREAPLYLLYVGGGRDLPKFEGVAAALATRRWIRFVGPQPDAARYFDAADIVVVPSHEEAFGLTALEGAAHTKPVIAAAVGGLPEIIRHEQEGLLYPPGDVRALAQALKLLLDDPAVAAAMGARGRVRAVRDFSQEALVRGVSRVIMKGWESS